MKKIVSICLLLLLIGANVSFAQDTTENLDQTQCGGLGYRNADTQQCEDPCGGQWTYNAQTQQCEQTTDTSTNQTSPTSVMGITCSPDQLTNGQCKLNIYDTLGIRKSVRDPDQATSVGLFVQDVILSATMFIGTLITIAIIVSGLMYIFAASSGKSPDNAKKGLTGSLIGLLIVVSSYMIIRLVQYIAKWF